MNHREKEKQLKFVFNKFLKEHNCLKEFYKNYKDWVITLSYPHLFSDRNVPDMVNHAFDENFCDYKEPEFWKDLDKKWKEYVKENGLIWLDVIYDYMDYKEK